MLDRAECGRRLRAAREKAGLSQDQAAERLGVKRPSYAQYELGRRVPSWINLHQMIDALGLDPSILMPEHVAPSGPGDPDHRRRVLESAARMTAVHAETLEKLAR